VITTTAMKESTAHAPPTLTVPRLPDAEY